MPEGSSSDAPVMRPGPSFLKKFLKRKVARLWTFGVSFEVVKVFPAGK
jgi:hypothetical protein